MTLPKITRDAFLYLDPKTDRNFAQCATCSMFDPKQNRCAILGPSVIVYPDSSCGLYVFGKPQTQILKSKVTPEEAGLVHRQVRCENCIYFNPEESHCELFEHLTEVFPDLFDLDKSVNSKGCCNAQTSAGKNLGGGAVASVKSVAKAALNHPKSENE